MGGMEWDRVEWNHEIGHVGWGMSRFRERFSKILMLQDVPARRWPSHGIRPYGLFAILGYKMERHSSGFFSELHYHYHHYHTSPTHVVYQHDCCRVQGGTIGSSVRI
jgi:hypothetical protein